uniref:60S ribosomal protein L28 n=1 Tax=Strongyloides venezuelensis TaxID=75913 RepID=A0A0K0G200_STRVS
MAGTERKVLQKYYTPGFDGSKVSRIRKKKSTYFMQRATVPFNMQYLPLVWQRLKSKEIYKIRIIRLKVMQQGCLEDGTGAKGRSISFKSSPSILTIINLMNVSACISTGT